MCATWLTCTNTTYRVLLGHSGEFSSLQVFFDLLDVFRDGADTETVVCALFHDVGEVMSPVCHGEIGINFHV